jgi:hypothetical protein
VLWAEGDELSKQVVSACLSGEKVGVTLRCLGISYVVYLEIVQSVLGVDTYATEAHHRKATIAVKNIKQAHAKWAALPPDQRAAILKARFCHGSKLEHEFVRQMTSIGITNIERNDWTSLMVNGKCVPREADIKVKLPQSRRLIILCDGEAFHGPRFVYGNAATRIQNDLDTAQAFYAAGYSIVRYSETEIKSGQALQHLLVSMERLNQVNRIYRTWYPHEERIDSVPPKPFLRPGG